ncbi:hypothetical protein LJB93_01985 [Desulfovibrio sp. OttesenSCG-928-F07]|nr:hypothetical protein [Desulfovibrio sp. OttesenSCG-928-F07]
MLRKTLCLFCCATFLFFSSILLAANVKLYESPLNEGTIGEISKAFTKMNIDERINFLVSNKKLTQKDVDLIHKEISDHEAKEQFVNFFMSMELMGLRQERNLNNEPERDFFTGAVINKKEIGEKAKAFSKMRNDDERARLIISLQRSSLQIFRNKLSEKDLNKCDELIVKFASGILKEADFK